MAKHDVADLVRQGKRYRSGVTCVATEEYGVPACHPHGHCMHSLGCKGEHPEVNNGYANGPTTRQQSL